MEENRRDVVNLNNLIKTLNHDILTHHPECEQLLDNIKSSEIKCTRDKCYKKLDKKINFHSKCQSNLTPPEPPEKPRHRRRVDTAANRKRRKINWKNNRRQRKQDHLQKKVDDIINNNIVINLSSYDIPDQAYLYLAYGLGFVPSQRCSKEDLTFDVNDFLRKLSWRAYFKENPTPDEDNIPREDIHKDLRIPSKAHPHYKNPLFEEVKTKINGWLGNFEPTEPPKNLSPEAIRGKNLLEKMIKDDKILVTKADKGGAILILDVDVVREKLEAELYNKDKFEELEDNADTHLADVTEVVKAVVVEMEEEGCISAQDRERITGLNDNLNMKRAHILKCQNPYVYPLFKVHKLSETDIKEKKIPPTRLVHASKFGPLYRLEKWISPILTKVSRSYCQDEYLLDTDDLLAQVNDYNKALELIPVNDREDLLLFTLDVEALYPSIRKDLALQSLQEALEEDRDTDENTKEAVNTFVQVIFGYSYVTFQGRCFRGKDGIPTGGCSSRQIADCSLCKLFRSIKPNMPLWEFIALWKRFIDDIFGLWRGSKAQFEEFVVKLNQAAAPFGIKFGDFSVGTSVNFLDVTLSLNAEGLIDYKLYIKPTDSRLYLRTESFHPSHVFSSVAMSQMLRIMNRNSTEAGKLRDLEKLEEDLERSGHNKGALLRVRERATERLSTPRFEEEVQDQESVVCVVNYFHEINQLKSILRDVDEDIKHLVGEDVNIMVAARRCTTIRDKVVKNKLFINDTDKPTSTFKPCKSKKCLTCPIYFSEGNVIVNTVNLNISNKNKFNCKTSNCIYLAICKICEAKGCSDIAYVGQTTQALHKRMNTHRTGFVKPVPGARPPVKTGKHKYEESALSLHAFQSHPDKFNLSHFKVTVLCQVGPLALDRQESFYIEKLRTNTRGLNRMVVRR